MLELVEHEDAKVRLAAVDQLLNRGFGKPRIQIATEVNWDIEVRIARFNDKGTVIGHVEPDGAFTPVPLEAMEE